MATWYRIEYEDFNGNPIRVDLLKTGYSGGSPASLQGYAVLEYEPVDSPFEVLRPSSATINVEASIDNEFAELYSEVEREWKVEIYRDYTTPEMIWQGWMLPDQIYEDYVQSVWMISMKAECGLASLTNKAYVDDFGELYRGQASLRQVLKNALSRTGIIDNIAFMQRSASTANFPLEVYEGGVTYSDFFDQKIDQIAFLDQTKKNARSCEEVLQEILGLANAYVVSVGDTWYINWAPQAGNPSISGVYTYDYYAGANIGVSPTTVTGEPLITIGPERAGYNLHWVNANQRIERRPSLAKVQSYYSYASLTALNANPDLDNNGSVISNWTWSPSGGGDSLNSEGTVTITSGGTSAARLTSDATANDIPLGNLIVFEAAFNVAPSTSGSTAYCRVGIEINDGVTTYYLWNRQGTIPLEWTDQTTIDGINSTYFNYGIQGTLDGTFTFKVETPAVPVEGAATIKIYSGGVLLGTEFTYITWDRIAISSIIAEKPQGATHSAERVANPSSFVEPNQTYTIGDWDGAPYGGTLYLTDGTTETDQGYSNPISTIARSLYKTNTIDRLFIRGYPARLFEGDVYGSGTLSQSFLPYNAVFQIAGFDGIQWMLMGLTWDTKQNIYSVKLWQMHWAPTAGAPGFENEVLDDILYEKITNFGNVIEPTIKG